jgi:hypothetical protein
VLFTDVGDDPGWGPLELPGHTGYVAGRYRNWAYSDVWTDVRRCAEGTFTGYRPACTCGWSGAATDADEVGWARCHKALGAEHLASLRRRARPAKVLGHGAGRRS